MTFINKTTLTEKTKSQISDFRNSNFPDSICRDRIEGRKGMCIWEGQIHGEGGSLRTVWEATNQQSKSQGQKILDLHWTYQWAGDKMTDGQWGKENKAKSTAEKFRWKC